MNTNISSKVIVFVLSICLIFTMMPTSALAAPDTDAVSDTVTEEDATPEQEEADHPEENTDASDGSTVPEENTDTSNGSIVSEENTDVRNNTEMDEEGAEPENSDDETAEPVETEENGTVMLQAAGAQQLCDQDKRQPEEGLYGYEHPYAAYDGHRCGADLG